MNRKIWRVLLEFWGQKMMSCEELLNAKRENHVLLAADAGVRSKRMGSDIVTSVQAHV